VNLARPCAVTHLSIGQASKINADVGFGHQANSEAYGDEGLDDASADIVAFDFGRSAVATNGETWSGVGAMAAWLKKLKDGGEDVERYRVPT
jgi:hypothetical protein